MNICKKKKTSGFNMDRKVYLYYLASIPEEKFFYNHCPKIFLSQKSCSAKCLKLDRKTPIADLFFSQVLGFH